MLEAALYHPHLVAKANEISAFVKSAEILRLLGRDILKVHKVHQQSIGPHVHHLPIALFLASIA